ncbi:MAG: hypothetical protein ACU836_16560, partial [Gammaproteobacteria bacterium]
IPYSGVYAALLTLTGPVDMPDTRPLVEEMPNDVKKVTWNGSDILAKIDIPVTIPSADVRAGLETPLVLTKGWYALVFAVTYSATGGAMPGNNLDIGNPLYFSWQGWWDLPFLRATANPTIGIMAVFMTPGSWSREIRKSRRCQALYCCLCLA